MAGTVKNVKVSPIQGKTELKYSSPFGPRSIPVNGKEYNNYHYGVDITTLGTVVAIADGIVTAVRKTVQGYSESLASGNYVTISHGNGIYTTYCHMDYGSICVKVGDKVVKGQKLGADIKKTTGFSTGLHLHFGIKVNGSFVDPIPYLQDARTISDKISSNAADFFSGKKCFQRGDTHENIGKIATFMRKTFPAYTKEAALGNYYGPNIEDAVRKFQERAKKEGRYSSTVDGKFGPITLASLKTYGFKEN